MSVQDGLDSGRIKRKIINMWHDNETIEDLLGFRIHSNVIKEVITDQELLPITVGLFGDWGSGKTSIMKMLQTDIDTTIPEDGKETVCMVV